MRSSKTLNVFNTLISDAPRLLNRALILGLLAGACSTQKSVRSEGQLPDVQKIMRLRMLPSVQILGQLDRESLFLDASWAEHDEQGGCRDGMVSINDEYCIDRFEASLVDVDAGRPVSPYYFPKSNEARRLNYYWSTLYARFGTERGRVTAPPELPLWEREEDFSVKAKSELGVIPNGYMDAIRAEAACENAGKRLCTVQEWRRACKGILQTKYPYGNEYEPGQCNYARSPHPAQLLQGGNEYRLTDPRFNLITVHGDPLLRATGATATCRSEWNGDGVYDMVGNLSEWVKKGEGEYAIAGGYYGRHRTQLGCEAAITQHAPQYYDYSIGTRCCHDAARTID